MAEVYWDLEWTLQQQGFDYTYDKRLYDRLRDRHTQPIREHFWAGLDYQDKLARFLENHDEPRAAATFPPGMHEAAAIITYLAPGLRFFHQGLFEGRKKRISPHLARAPEEPVDQNLEPFYDRLLAVLRQPLVREGQWRSLDCQPAWDGNGSCENFIAFAWQGSRGERLLVAVNYAGESSQCYVRLPFEDLSGRVWRFQDRLSTATYDRDGENLQSRGLFLDVPPWHGHVFVIQEPVPVGNGSTFTSPDKMGTGTSKTRSQSPFCQGLSRKPARRWRPHHTLDEPAILLWNDDRYAVP
jgi:hypothetical protein